MVESLGRCYLRLWRRLPSAQRAGAVVSVLGNLVTSMLEVLGLMLFGMVLAYITKSGARPADGWLAHLAAVTGASPVRVLIAACGIVYVVKNGLLTALAWLEAKLAFGVQGHLSGEVLTAVLGEDFEDASRHEASARIHLLTGGMTALSHNVMLPVLTLFAEITLMLALVLFLLLTQPLFIAAILVVLCAAAGLLVFITRRQVLRLGHAREKAEDARLRLLSGVFNHLREIYIYSAATRAADHMRVQMNALGAACRSFQMIYTTPRFALELTLVGSLLVALFLRSDVLDASVVVSVGVFGAAAFRLLLGINRIVSSVQAMRFTGVVVEAVAKALDTPAAPPVTGRGRSGAAHGSLSLCGVTYSYVEGKPVLQGVDLVLPRRALVAIKGRSGAGKSTLLEILAGLRTHDAGAVTLDGQLIGRKQDLVGRVAYAGQDPAVFPDTIRGNVALGQAREAIDDQAVWRALERAHLDEVVRALPGQLDHVLGARHRLSGGQMQRLGLARALYMDCDYLLLDEPTAALDPETEQQLLATFRELAATTGVLVVSHRPAPLQAADEIWELRNGRLVRAAADSAPGAEERLPAEEAEGDRIPC
jgi:ABC-type multidrug transport system fused ATPase/permease subunit